MPMMSRFLPAEVEPEVTASEQEAVELGDRKQKLALRNLITGQGNKLGFVELAYRALVIAAVGLEEITLNAMEPGIFNLLPKNQAKTSYGF
jgi:hypothetical protein